MEQFKLTAVLWRFVKQITLAPYKTHQRHDHVFAVGVDGGIGNLSEELFEVVIEQLRPLRQYGQRRVITHASHRFLTVFSHGGNGDYAIFNGIAKRFLLTTELGRFNRKRPRGLKESGQFNTVTFEPAPVGFLTRDRGFDFVIVDNPVVLCVNQQHFPRGQTTFLQNIFRGYFQNPHFGGHDHLAAFGDNVARRAQTVAIKRGADFSAIGKGHGRRTVPGLHNGRVIFVERTLILTDMIARPEGLGHHHHHGVFNRAPAEGEQFKDIVKNTGIAEIGTHHRNKRIDLFTEEFGFEC